MTRYIFRGCRRCGGDLYLNYENRRNSDWICLQCGRHPERLASPQRGLIHGGWNDGRV